MYISDYSYDIFILPILAKKCKQFLSFGFGAYTFYVNEFMVENKMHSRYTCNVINGD